MRRFGTAAAQRVGFIGLGNMGRHMAANLVKAGHALTVYDVVPGATEALKAAGATVETSPARVAAAVDTLITMLPSSPHVKAVYEGKDGVLSAAKESAILIDCSTIHPGVARDVTAAAESRGLRMVDAPVSGGVGGAEAATLTFMVGGSADNFKAVKPFLSVMGKNIVHCGGPGNGQVAKLCNNLILGITMIGVSEAMNLGVHLGIDPKVLASIVSTSSGRCWSNDTYNPCPGVMDGVPSSRGYTGGFGAALMQKDLGLASEAAKTVNVPLPLGGAAYSLYSLLSRHGAGTRDFSVVYEFLSGAKTPKSG